MAIRRYPVIAALGALLAATLAAPPAAPAQTQVFLWPAQFSFGTPSGTFTWSATSLGVRFGPGLGPVEFGTTLSYGSITNLSFAGSLLSGYSGQMVAGEVGPRLALGAGPLGVGASAGYGGFVVNARGPASTDALLLSSLGFRLGLEGRLSIAPALALRGSWHALTGLSQRAEFSLSSPGVAAQHSGSGSGSEFRIGLAFSPLPLVEGFAEYRSGSFTTVWSAGGSTPSSYSGYLLGVRLSF